MKEKSKNNRTLQIDYSELELLRKQVKYDITKSQNNEIINNNYEFVIDNIIPKSVDLLILDPPYNLDKKFNNLDWNKVSVEKYNQYLDDVLIKLKPLLKDTATIYICGDWLSSVSIYEVVSKHFVVRNRITWEREKGRGSKTNYKNSTEDIWFCTMSNDYTFNVDDIKLRKKVLAPYKDKNSGEAKDWKETSDGKFRDTYPSNIWTDITIPFWSMPENTDHPTQKSEKLLAKLILASSNEGDLIFDPMCGVATTAVVAKKLNRNYIAIELDEKYCLLGQKRLNKAEHDRTIQGYENKVFYERNSKP